MKSAFFASIMMSLLAWGVAPLYGQDSVPDPVAKDAWQLPVLNDLLTGESYEAMFEAWPSMSNVLDVAMNNLSRTLREPHAWGLRRGLASLLPVVRVGESVREGNYDRYLLERDPNDRNRLDDFSLDDGIREYDYASIWLQWDLSDLIFHQDEMEAASVERELAEFRARFSRDIITSYHKLKYTCALLERELMSTEIDRINLQMERDILMDYLDHATAGYFKQAVQGD
ncbi:MAG: hypothetical protein ACO3ZG_08570 [Kiritimatiellia bacterium]